MIEYQKGIDFTKRPPCPICGAYAGRWDCRARGALYCGECGAYYSVGTGRAIHNKNIIAEIKGISL
jgi:hypothetical protein